MLLPQTNKQTKNVSTRIQCFQQYVTSSWKKYISTKLCKHGSLYIVLNTQYTKCLFGKKKRLNSNEFNQFIFLEINWMERELVAFFRVETNSSASLVAKESSAANWRLPAKKLKMIGCQLVENGLRCWTLSNSGRWRVNRPISWFWAPVWTRPHAFYPSFKQISLVTDSPRLFLQGIITMPNNCIKSGGDDDNNKNCCKILQFYSPLLPDALKLNSISTTSGKYSCYFRALHRFSCA